MKKKFVIVIIMICFILTGCVNKSNYDNLNTNNKIDDNIQTEEKQISPKKGTIEEKEYKVKFDTDGGSDIESQTVKENLLITEPNAPTKSGYVFKEWVLNGETYDFNKQVTNDVTLTAVYIKEDKKTYTVKFNTDGGSKINDKIVEENNVVSKPSNPLKSGYIFKEWQLNGSKYNFDLKVTKNITLKAVYTKVEDKKTEIISTKTYVVSFDTDGGSKIEDKIVEENKVVSKPLNPTKSGYTFKEWQLNGKAYNFNTKVTSDITLTAIYDADYVQNFDCVFDGDLVQGAEYINGQYVYRYKQKAVPNGEIYGRVLGEYHWWNMDSDIDGWGVHVLDRNSTKPITTKLCKNINGKPIVSTRYMFYYSAAPSIDLSSFDTSNVIDMTAMFAGSKAKTIGGLQKFNTSNVQYMDSMFQDSKVESLNLSSFDTRKVISMSAMFSESIVDEIDISNFKTPKSVTTAYMFYKSAATIIKLPKDFKTNGVISMFSYSNITNLDLSNLDTSEVTNMESMFYENKSKTINLNNFDTRKVTNMKKMFSGTAALELDLSSFNTSNVTDMSYMFNGSKVKKINLTSFDTAHPINMQYTFYNSDINTLDLSSFDTKDLSLYRTIGCVLFKGYAKTQEDANRLNSSFASGCYKNTSPFIVR